MTNLGLKRCIKAVFAILVAISVSPGCATKDEPFSRQLTEWKIAPAVSATTPALNAIAVKDDAAKAIDYSTSDWLKAIVPGTVLGNLVDDGVYDDIFQPDTDGEINDYFNDNLSRIPEGILRISGGTALILRFLQAKQEKKSSSRSKASAIQARYM